MKRKELFWMLIPCLLFAGAAWWLRPREAQWERQEQLRQAQLNKPLQLVVEKVERRAITPGQAQEGYDTQIIVTLNHKGKKPAWWGKISSCGESGWTGAGNAGILFYESKNQRRPVFIDSNSQYKMSAFYQRPVFNAKTDKYEAQFLMTLRHLPISKDKIVFRSPVAIEDCRPSPAKQLTPAVKVNYIIRQPYQKITMPKLSHNPQATVKSIEIKKLTLTEQQANGGIDTEIHLFIQGKVAASGIPSLNGDEFLNGKGKRVSPYVYVTGFISAVPNIGPTMANKPKSSKPSLQDEWIIQWKFQQMPAREKDVTLKMEYRHGDAWPMEIRIPMRRNGKDIQGLLAPSQIKSKPL